MDPSDLDPRSLAVDATEELYRLIAETIPQIVWCAHADGTDEFHNGRACEYSGLERSQLAGAGWKRASNSEPKAGR